MRSNVGQDGDLMCKETRESHLFSFRLSAAIERKNDTMTLSSRKRKWDLKQPLVQK